MDFSTRKLNLIAYLAQIKDEGFFSKLENFILENKKEIFSDLKPFTIEELINRIKKSEIDFQNGNFKSQDDLEKLSEKW